MSIHHQWQAAEDQVTGLLRMRIIASHDTGELWNRWSIGVVADWYKGPAVVRQGQTYRGTLKDCRNELIKHAPEEMKNRCEQIKKISASYAWLSQAVKKQDTASASKAYDELLVDMGYMPGRYVLRYTRCAAPVSDIGTPCVVFKSSHIGSCVRCGE